jgi:hypothetical protein
VVEKSQAGTRKSQRLGLKRESIYRRSPQPPSFLDYFYRFLGCMILVLLPCSGFFFPWMIPETQKSAEKTIDYDASKRSWKR